MYGETGGGNYSENNATFVDHLASQDSSDFPPAEISRWAACGKNVKTTLETIHKAPVVIEGHNWKQRPVLLSLQELP